MITNTNNQSVSLNPLVRFISIFTNPTVVTKPITPTLPENHSQELLEMLSQQTRINNLVYSWQSDEQGKIQGKWVKSA